MSIDDEHQNPFSRPGFVAAAVLVFLVVAVGVVLVIVNVTSGDAPRPSPTTASPVGTADPTTAPPTTEESAAPSNPSICGLKGEVLSGSLTAAPAAEWKHYGTSTYPTSPEYGPAATDPAGFHYCYQRSPQGALLAATYAAVAGTDPTIARVYIDYFAAEGPHRDRLIAEAQARGGGDSGDIRLRVAGFRLLDYDATVATVDIALITSIEGETVHLSIVYPLVWSDGDWKLRTDIAEPGSVASIPDLVGYTTWGQ